MKNYDKTLWQNNKTVVDADYLNNIEDQVQILTLNSIKNNEKLQVIENTLPMKAAKDHLDYIIKEYAKIGLTIEADEWLHASDEYGEHAWQMSIGEIEI